MDMTPQAKPLMGHLLPSLDKALTVSRQSDDAADRRASVRLRSGMLNHKWMVCAKTAGHRRAIIEPLDNVGRGIDPVPQANSA